MVFTRVSGCSAIWCAEDSYSTASRAWNVTKRILQWVSVHIILHLGNALFHPHEYDIVKYVSENSQWTYSLRNNSVTAYEIKTLLGRLLFVVQDRSGSLSRAQSII